MSKEPSRLWIIHEWLMVNLPRTTGLQFKVLYALAFHINAETGDCFPSLVTLAEHAGCDKKSVIRALDELAEMKIIRITPGTAGRGHSSRYTPLATPDAVAEFKARRERKRAARTSQKVANVLPFRAPEKVAQ